MIEQKKSSTFIQIIPYLFCAFLVVFLSCFTCVIACKNYYDKEYQTNNTQVISNNNINTNISKKIDIKSLNKDSNNVIQLFNIENYSTGLIHFNQGENPTIYNLGDSIIIVAFSLEVNANIKYKHEKFYIDTLNYTFTSKFTQSIPIDQLTYYEFDYAREVREEGSFLITWEDDDQKDLCLLENINYFIFECNSYMETRSMFDDNGIIFNNKLSFNDINGGWVINEFYTSAVGGFYDTNKFFTNGTYLKIVHQPSVKFYINGTYQVITDNYDKDYQIGYDRGFYDGMIETFDKYPLIDKTNITIKYVWSTISNAINSVLNVFDTEILPGIPLYVLIMIPVIISVLFFVFKVVKK